MLVHMMYCFPFPHASEALIYKWCIDVLLAVTCRFQDTSMKDK